MQCGEIPSGICSCFDDELVLSGETKRLLITLGQFSIVRLERETQLLIPVFDYCIPTKQCNDTAVNSDENPCDMFSRIEFPVDEFFPASCEPLTGNTSGNQCGCGCSYRTSGS